MKLVVDNTGGGNPPMPRELNEAEVRAGFTLTVLMLGKARATIGKWHLGGKRPRLAEYEQLMFDLLGVEQAIMALSAEPPTDGHGLDTHIERVAQELEALRGRA